METIFTASDDEAREHLPTPWEDAGEPERLPERLRATITRHPRESLLGGIGAGYLLAHLPLLKITCGLVRVGFVLLRPALLTYAVIKLAEPFRKH